MMQLGQEERTRHKYCEEVLMLSGWLVVVMEIYKNVMRVKEKNGGIHLDSKNSGKLVMPSERTSHIGGKTDLCWSQSQGRGRIWKGSEQRRSLIQVCWMNVIGKDDDWEDVPFVINISPCWNISGDAFLPGSPTFSFCV